MTSPEEDFGGLATAMRIARALTAATWKLPPGVTEKSGCTDCIAIVYGPSEDIWE